MDQNAASKAKEETHIDIEILESDVLLPMNLTDEIQKR